MALTLGTFFKAIGSALGIKGKPIEYGLPWLLSYVTDPQGTTQELNARIVGAAMPVVAATRTDIHAAVDRAFRAAEDDAAQAHKLVNTYIDRELDKLAGRLSELKL